VHERLRQSRVGAHLLAVETQPDHRPLERRRQMRSPRRHQVEHIAPHRDEPGMEGGERDEGAGVEMDDEARRRIEEPVVLLVAAAEGAGWKRDGS
jgi:hypothetical protein